MAWGAVEQHAAWYPERQWSLMDPISMCVLGHDASHRPLLCLYQPHVGSRPRLGGQHS
jgi:hypothetical protein